MAKSKKQSPIPLSCWPEAAPSPEEEKMLSLSVGNSHISWAIHESVELGLVPTLFWRTPHIDLSEADNGTNCEILSTYLSDLARQLIFGSKSADPTKQSAIQASIKRRVSLLSVYVLSTNDSQLQTLATVLRDIPCRIYLLQGDDFFTKEDGRYDGMGIDRLAALRAAGDFKGFPALVFDGGTALTYTAADKDGKILGGGIGPGVQATLKCLSDYTCALPHISPKALMKELASLTDDDGNVVETLPVFARTSQQNIITNLCRTIASNGHSVIRSYLAKVGEAEENDPNNADIGRRVHVTGGDADLIAKLLEANCSNLLDMQPSPLSSSQYSVRKMKHMIHYGIAGALKRKALAFKESASADMDTLLIGQRVAKKFPKPAEDQDYVYRGSIACVQADSKFPYHVRYDDGEDEDLDAVQLYEALKLYMNVGEKDRYAGPPRAEKINGAKEAANTLAEKDKLVKKSIEEKEKKKKSTPPAPSLAPESETTSSSKRPTAEASGGSRKKAKKYPSGLTKPEKEYAGDRIAKYFGDDVYFGTVGEFWYDSEDEESLWRIDYDDGDKEDLAKDEFVEALKLYQKQKGKDPKRK